jgi:SAM-dependent methyltransferase
MREVTRVLKERITPVFVQRRRARREQRDYWPPVGTVRFGDFRRRYPISNQFGFDRGLPVDRYFIEKFLDAHRSDVRGHVLEIGDNQYTMRFGQAAVTRSDIWHVSALCPYATIVGDLTSCEHVPSDAFDCAIITQTLHLIYDFRAALRSLHRILRPGGVLLLTAPGISQLSYDQWANAWCWSFTKLALVQILAETFPSTDCQISSFGNVLAATAFLQGVAANELSHQELEFSDDRYQCIITVRAVKA